MLVKFYSMKAAKKQGCGLTVNHIYEVLGIESDSYRLLSDATSETFPNDPVLYPPEYFDLIDTARPRFWVTEVGEEGEEYAYPQSWMRPGFFEDFHDGVEKVREQFWKDLQHLYPRSWNERKGYLRF